MLWIVGRIAADLKTYLDDRQTKYGILVDKSKPWAQQPYEVPVMNCDFSSQSALTASVTGKNMPPVSGVMTSGYEQYVVPSAWLARHFGVAGTSEESAMAATDKFLMRQRFKAAAPEITPDFQVVGSLEEAETFANTHDFPLILKPTNLMKSLFVSKVNNLDELRNHYRVLADNLLPLQKRFDLQQPPQILIEEFLQGSMHTVAGFAGADGSFYAAPGITDCLTAQDIGVKDNYLYARRLPSALNQRQAESIFTTAGKGVKALGLTSTPLHVEIMLTPEGPKIIEIGARLGGYRPRMYLAGFGIDLYQAAISVALGQKPSLVPTQANCQAVVELFPETVGVFEGVINADKLQSHPAYQNLTLKFPVGKQVGPANKGFLAAAIISVGHVDEQTFENCLDYIRQNVRVKVRT